MEKIGYVNWTIWMGITMLLSSMEDIVIAQPGFLSIDCGAKTNYTDENSMSWVTDHNYIDVGETADTGSATSPSYLQTLRFFPQPLNRSCYHLPVVPNVPYLLRLSFSLGNYGRFNGSYAGFIHTIETLGTSVYSEVKIGVTDPNIYYERICVSSGTVLYICLIKTSDTDDPFINAIELRTLRNGMYSQAEPGTMLFLQTRTEFGGNSPVRYPQDNFDRIWRTNFNLNSPNDVLPVSSPEPISSNNTKNHPPTAVMQTAWVLNTDDFSIGVGVTTASSAKSLLLLYFAEIERLNISESRSFYVTIEGEEPSETSCITLLRNYSALEVTFISNETDEFVFDLVKAPNTTKRPIINALEYYTILHTNFRPGTSFQDIKALNAIQSQYEIEDWIDDPCRWKGLRCVNISFAPPLIRISEIDLSGRNLTGSVSEYIGQLTALINVSLDNNHLMGTLPNFSSLTMLERLHLQNNYFTGSLPDWLFKLENLKELSLDNNHLMGTLPNFSSLTMLERLHLQNNYLTGSLPDWLFKLENLKELSLDNNHLMGTLPNFSSLTMLERLHLQNNYLTGNLPDWLFKLENLKELSLDNNHLMGTLPNFSSLTMLERLHLQNNYLTGSLPDWLFKLENLKELFIQNNNFSGEIAEELFDKTSLNVKYSGNDYLCVSRGGKCIQENHGTIISKSVVLGITISGCLIIALALMAGVVVYWRKLREKQRLNKDSVMILSKLTKSRPFTAKEMMQATENFNRSIGQGGSGSVFFGKLREEEHIAVKVLSSLKQFLHEVEVHSKAEHDNLMSLLGYCFEPKNYMLIYKHMSGGSLRDSLHGPRTEHSDLGWKTRLKIALDAAQGLQFLHEGCASKIIHMDIKTDNILLDSNMNAKLADFGLSRVTSDGEATHATMSTVKGTHGYIDPEYNRSHKVTEKNDVYHKVTEKSDVYSFGVVLFEIICGRPPINANPPEEEVNLIQWVTPYVRGDEIGEEIIDKRLAGKYDMKSIVRVAKVALRCVSDDSRCRPSISEVVEEIKEAIIHENEKEIVME